MTRWHTAAAESARDFSHALFQWDNHLPSSEGACLIWDCSKVAIFLSACTCGYVSGSGILCFEPSACWKSARDALEGRIKARACVNWSNRRRKLSVLLPLNGAIRRRERVATRKCDVLSVKQSERLPRFCSFSVVHFRLVLNKSSPGCRRCFFFSTLSFVNKFTHR